MLKWILRLVAMAAMGFVGLLVLELHRGGYFELKEVPEGACTASFKSGLRAIVVDPEVARPATCSGNKYFRRLQNADPHRRYISVPFEVPYWAEDAWSTCTAPTDRERHEYRSGMPEEWTELLDDARFDAVCRLDVDGREMVRGLLFSVPKL